MQIIHKMDDFLFTIFPEILGKVNNEFIIHTLENYYAYGPGNSYKLTYIPKKDFSGYHLLAYYYVSLMLAMPEMLDELGLDYEKEV